MIIYSRVKVQQLGGKVGRKENNLADSKIRERRGERRCTGADSPAALRGDHGEACRTYKPVEDHVGTDIPAATWRTPIFEQVEMT